MYVFTGARDNTSRAHLFAAAALVGVLGSAGAARAGLALNLDASDLSKINSGTITDGQAVTAWGQQYGNTVAGGPLTATGAPVWNATGLNGLPTITLDGVDDSLSSSTLGSFINNDNWTVLFVANTNNTGQPSQTIFANPNGFTASGGGTSIRYRNNTNGWWFRNRDASGGGQQDAMTFPLIDYDNNPASPSLSGGRGEVALRGIAADGSRFLGYYNDAAPVLTPLDPGNTTLWDNSSPLYIGGRSVGNWFFNGNVSQVVAFDQQLTGADLSNVQQALSDKWSLGVNYGGDAAVGNLLLRGQQQQAPPPTTVADFATPRTKKPGQPGYGETIMRTLKSGRTSPNPPYDVFEAISTFGVTRLYWVYPRGNQQFVQDVVATGTIFGGAVSGGGMPDVPGGTTQLIGRDKDLNGNIVISHPEFISLPAYGDPASDAYRQVLLDNLKLIIDNGGTTVQFDDPGGAWVALLNKNSGGGYGDAAITKFAVFLDQNTTSQDRTSYGLPQDLTNFDYRDWVLNTQGGSDETQVRVLFEGFHREQTAETYAFLKTQINNYAGFYVPFSFNNNSTTNQTSFIVSLPEIDFWIGETSQEFGQAASGGPQNIYNKIKNAEALGMFQMFTGPNDGLDFIPTRNEFLGISRNVFAASYASGSMMLIPWDKFRKDTDRFFVTEAEFSDLTDLIGDNRALFNDHEEVFAVGTGLAPQFAAGLATEPARLNGAGVDVMLTVRAVPNDPDAPIVVHMVDFKFFNPDDTITVDLHNELFGWNPDLKMYARLMLLGQAPIWVSGILGLDGYTTFKIPQLTPYGLLVVPGLIPGDMNNDRGYTTADIDLLQLAVDDPAAFAAMYPGVDAATVGDTNGDGALDSLDIDYLVVQILRTQFGDLDGDGFVGINDLNVVLGAWNQGVTPGDWTLGDPSGDGFVGIEDLNTVLGNWNAGTPPDTRQVIPETNTLILFSGGVWMMIYAHPRHCRTTAKCFVRTLEHT
jgi:hypothetical protein